MKNIKNVNFKLCSMNQINNSYTKDKQKHLSFKIRPA